MKDGGTEFFGSENSDKVHLFNLKDPSMMMLFTSNTDREHCDTCIHRLWWNKKRRQEV